MPARLCSRLRDRTCNIDTADVAAIFQFVSMPSVSGRALRRLQVFVRSRFLPLSFYTLGFRAALYDYKMAGTEGTSD